MDFAQDLRHEHGKNEKTSYGVNEHASCRRYSSSVSVPSRVCMSAIKTGRWIISSVPFCFVFKDSVIEVRKC